MNKKPHNPRDPHVLISAYLDETISREDAKALNAWVKADAANARELAKAVWLHRRVYDLKHVEDIQRLNDPALELDASEGSSLLGAWLEMERDAGEVELVDLTEELKRRKNRKSYEKARRFAMMLPRKAEPDDIRRPTIIPLWFAYGVAAMIAIGAVVGLYAVFSPLGSQDQKITQTPGDPPIAVEPVAHLTASNDLRFADAQRSVLAGSPMIPGKIVLTRGTAEITFNSGAVVVIAAPATIELQEDNLATLHVGTLAAVVPPRARGFAIDTPTMRIVDLGTQFGVSVDAAMSCEVQVFLGEVTAAVTDVQGEVGPSQSLRTSEGIRVNAATRIAEEIEVDAKGYDELLPHLKLLYRNLVVNGDFEQGATARITGQQFGDVQNLRVPGWEDESPGTVLGYDEAAVFNYPNPRNHSMPDNRGQAYYAGMGAGAIRQRIDISELANLTDEQKVRFDMSAWLGGFMENDEYILLTVRFMDLEGEQVGQDLSLEPVRSSSRQDISGFLYRDLEGAIPAGTRQVVIEMENIGVNQPPTVRDSYADNVSLELFVD